MRWWEVSRRHGVPMVSHDGSGFDSHANVVLGYTCAWHRMTKLAIVRRDDPAGCRRQGDRKRVGLRVRRPSYERRGLPGLRRGRRHKTRLTLDMRSPAQVVGAAPDARIRFREVEDNDELLVRIVHEVGDPHL